LKAGVPLKVVSERLGHSTPAFTMATYQHVLPGMQAEAAATFASLMDEAEE
jgi:integrase